MSGYEFNYRNEMDKFYPNLWAQLDLLPSLEPELARNVLHYLLSFCHMQNVGNIMIGRRAICAIPRDWLFAHIEAAAAFLYTDNLENDDWEYRRLGEIYRELGNEDLLRRHIQRGLVTDNADIKEAAQDFLDVLEHGRSGANAQGE